MREFEADWLRVFFISFCDNYCCHEHDCSHCPIKTVEKKHLKLIKIKKLIEVVERLG